MMTERNGEEREEKVWESRSKRRGPVDDTAINDHKISMSSVSKENGKKDFSVTENNHSLECLSRKAGLECIPSYRMFCCHSSFWDMRL